MNAIALPRITLPIFDVQLFEVELKKAGDLLDYVHGYQTLRDQQLLRTLDEMGILPFERAAVTEYKKKMKRANLFKMPWNRRHWYTTELRRYSAPVPLEVLKKANEIRVRHTVTVGVDYFALEARDYYADPFLWVQASDTTPRHHIAVWDEPKFM